MCLIAYTYNLTLYIFKTEPCVVKSLELDATALTDMAECSNSRIWRKYEECISSRNLEKIRGNAVAVEYGENR